MRALLLTTVTIFLLIIAVPAYAQDDASLTAMSMSYEETEGGINITLEGPVEIVLHGDRMTSESAVVTLSDDLTSLEDAIISIDLVGSVNV